eukprot:30983-Pelagococcus_subviridis.AAC.5
MIAGIVAGVVVAFPPLIFSVMAAFFKPRLRRILLKWGFKRLADGIVPGLGGRISKLEAFMAKQKLPRLHGFTPEIDPSEITINKADVLGTGSYGTVYKASHISEEVAVKAMFESANDRLPAYAAKLLRNEAMLMCSRGHSKRLARQGAVRGRATRDTYLHDPDNTLDASDKARLATETATGMAYLHMREVDIIHGDIKAGNVLLVSDKSVRICDFGMAEAKNRSKTVTSAAAASNGRSSVALTVYANLLLF